MKNIAIIPARSGSKGLPDKNIKELNGKPLIAYTIEAALASNRFDKVFVSTDSEIYADLAEQYGAIARPLRPAELSTDTAGSIDVILHVLAEEAQGYDTFCLLQPTSPLRTATHIDEAYALYEEKQATSVISMVKSDKSPNIINTFNGDGTIHNFLKLDQKNYRRQDEVYYIPNGGIFLSEIDYFVNNLDFYGERSYPYVMDKRSSIDVDDIYDFMLVEILEGQGQ